MPGGTIFIPWQHCRICKAERHKQQGKNVSIPHRSHHVRCPRNVKTKGISARFVTVNNTARINLMTNRAGLSSSLGRRLNAGSHSTACPRKNITTTNCTGEAVRDVRQSALKTATRITSNTCDKDPKKTQCMYSFLNKLAIYYVNNPPVSPLYK